MDNLGKYNKLWVALVGAVVIIAIRHFGADNMYVLDLISLLTAAGVYQVPNVKEK